MAQCCFLCCGIEGKGTHAKTRDWAQQQLPSPRNSQGCLLVSGKGSFFSLTFYWSIVALQWLPWWLSGKESACQWRRRWFDSWVGKIPWRRKWHPTPVFLPGKPHGQRSLMGYSPWGGKESETTEWLKNNNTAALQCPVSPWRVSQLYVCPLFFRFSFSFTSPQSYKTIASNKIKPRWHSPPQTKFKSFPCLSGVHGSEAELQHKPLQGHGTGAQKALGSGWSRWGPRDGFPVPFQ